ncbi:MAG: DUF3035 domain-containing protein [Paracoccaceae bacterium]
MRAAARLLALAVIAAAALQGCGRNSDKVPNLMNIRAATRTPDEFAILPTKPLQLPEDIAALPEPTPGEANLTDPTPEADAVAALGGNPDRLTRKGTVTSDGGLVTYAARFGVAPDIRDTLAAEDLSWRQRNKGRPLERLFDINVYFKAYRRMSLDQHLELERWRKAGVRTVGAPPDPEAQ